MTWNVDNFAGSREAEISQRCDSTRVKAGLRTAARGTGGGFTIIELIVVMTIIAVLVAVSVPAIRSVSKSNDSSQAENLVRSEIGTARAIAVSQHRMAGVVFFEETPTFSQPANANQTAMQLFVEDFNQSNYPVGVTPAGDRYYYFVKYTSARQYLPAGMKIAALTDTGTSVETGDAASTSNYLARAILFDSNGQLVMHAGLATPLQSAPTVANAGTYPQAYGDWRFLNAPANPATGALAAVAANSYPGFFIYRKDEYDSQPAGTQVTWLRRNSSVILVNANTGTVIVDRGTGQ